MFRFICAKKLQKTKKCDDFEVRFCCPKNHLANQTIGQSSFNADAEKLKNISIADLSFAISIPSSIGLKCESGDVHDCNLSMTMEVLPFSCKGILMFSTNNETACGSKCDIKNTKSRSRTPTRRGWTKWSR